MSVQVSYTKQFGLGIILFIILLGVIEIFSIVVLDQKDSCNEGLWESRLFSEYSHSFVKSLCSDYKSMIDYQTPYKHWEPNQNSNSVNINSLGVRGDEISISKDSDTYRIVMLGGSAMYGLFATSDSSTIAGFLEKKIHDENPEFNVEIINAGVNGATSFDETRFLDDKLLQLDPDMVFVYDGANDLAYKIEDKHLSDTTWPSEIEKFVIKLRNYYKTIQLIDFLDRIIQKNVFDENNRKLEEHEEQHIEQKVELWKDRWEKICKSDKMNDIQFVISIQPYLGVGTKDLSDWEMLMKQTNKNMDLSEFYPMMISELKNIDSDCARTLDLTNVYDEYTETIFYDLVHVVDFGNKIVADRIYEEIIPILENKFK